jgi:hypothetical protein
MYNSHHNHMQILKPMLQKTQKLSIDHLFSPWHQAMERENIGKQTKQCKPDMTCNTGGYEGKKSWPAR